MSFFFFLQNQRNRRVEEFLVGSVPVVGGRMWEKVQEDEYGANTVYTCM
jgi:hypothetical protein